MVSNREISRIFEHIAEILQIKGENPFKIRAYQKAAITIAGLPEELGAFQDLSEIRKLPGIGEALLKKIGELLETGRLKYYENLKQSDYARLVFALKQASQRTAGQAPSILHVEDDDSLANLVQNTIGRQARLFRARSAHEAQIAMALRNYDLALVRTHVATRSDQWKDNLAGEQQTLYIDTNSASDPFLTILNNLRRNTYLHQPAYC